MVPDGACEWGINVFRTGRCIWPNSPECRSRSTTYPILQDLSEVQPEMDVGLTKFSVHVLTLLEVCSQFFLVNLVTLGDKE